MICIAQQIILIIVMQMQIEGRLSNHKKNIKMKILKHEKIPLKYPHENDKRLHFLIKDLEILKPKIFIRIQH